MRAAAIKSFVLDASVTLAWCFADESTAYTEAVLDFLSSGSVALVPAIWPFEVANALLMAQRRKRITLAQVTSVLQRIALLPITIEFITMGRAFGAIFSGAQREGLTAYDAAYIELAMREGLAFATLDNGLRRAAQRAGVPLLVI